MSSVEASLLNDSASLYVPKKSWYGRNKAHSKFKFLDHWMLYLIFVPRLPSKGQRSLYFRIFYICWNIFVLLSFCGIAVVIALKTLPIYRDRELVWAIYYSVFVSLFIPIKLMSVIYYHYHFEYPWHRQMSVEHSSGVISINGSRHINEEEKDFEAGFIGKYFKPIIIMFILAKFTFIVFEIRSNVIILNEYVLIELLMLIAQTMMQLLYFIPVFFIFIVQSAICYKYHRYLLQLIDKLQNAQLTDLDFTQLLVEYKSIFDEWTKDYNFYLKWTAQIMLVSLILSAWAGIYHTIYADVYDILLGALTILLYFISASLLSDTFDSMQCLLWKHMNERIGYNDKQKEEHRLSLFIEYTKHYPLHIEFAGITVSKKNIFIFLLAFIAARFDAPTQTNFIQNF